MNKNYYDNEDDLIQDAYDAYRAEVEQQQYDEWIIETQKKLSEL